MDLSVVIVNYNGGDLLTRCLDSLGPEVQKGTLDVLVVDNASSDGSVDVLPTQGWLQLIRNPLNVGFAAAANEGLRRARGRYFLLLNPDAQVMVDTLERMVRFMDDHPEAALAGGRVEDPDGTLQGPCRRQIPRPGTSLMKLSGLARLWPNSSLARGYEMGDEGSGSPEPVEAISGAFMMGRRELLETVGFLDEAFFLYGEDLDYCLRVAQAGLLIYYVPEARVVHCRGHSRFQLPRRSIREGHRSMRLFYDKHQAGEHGALFNALIRGAIGLRCLVIQALAQTSRSAARTLMSIRESPGETS